MKSQIEKDIENPVEKIATSLEVSRKLKALGIIQESCFYWVRTPVYSIDGAEIKWVIVDENELMTYLSADEVHEKISAFTVTELANMIDFGSKGHTCPDSQAYSIIESLARHGDVQGGVKHLSKNLKKWREE